MVFMPGREALSQKPRSEEIRTGITRLPRLTLRRQVLRGMVRWLARLAVFLLTRTRVSGLEKLLERGPGLLVFNHLGDADLVVWAAYTPLVVEALGKVELLDFPILGKLLDAYGVIWVHRGQPDRAAFRAVFEGFKEGRMVAIAPEGRESLTGSLEEGTGGAAYLALKSGVPVIPVTFTGTENWRIYGNLKRLRRTDVTVTIGDPFKISSLPGRREAVERGTELIMRRLAEQLPEEYRGMYQMEIEDEGARTRQ
jgi:1-acyl-sn-glycerol-3-phosphate acyltransferase